eukprot:GEMP01057286.1.p1 GENE.GEMP01057286.1~~GEMP01057286.1.p1  ORF type:complete len:327 (+),score=34.46 GEMP01057286.1:123-983(+)
MGSLKCLDAVLLQKPCEFNRARCSCQAAVSCNSDLWGPCANCPLLEFHRLCVLNDGRFGYCFYDNCFECTSNRHCKDKSKSKCYSDGNCAGCSSHHLCNHECTSSGAVCDVFITSTTATHATASLPETPVIDRLLPYLLLIGVVAGCSLLLCGIYKYICRRYLVYSRDPLPAAISFLEINRKKDETSETFSAEKPRIRPMASQDNYDITEQQTASPIVPPFSSIRVTSAIDISSRHLNHSCPDWDLVLPIISSADIPIANQSLDRGRSQGESTAIWRPIRTITTYG